MLEIPCQEHELKDLLLINILLFLSATPGTGQQQGGTVTVLFYNYNQEVPEVFDLQQG
jgi:hypothetical protein